MVFIYTKSGAAGVAAPFSVLLKRRDGRVQRRDGTDALPPREQLAADFRRRVFE